MLAYGASADQVDEIARIGKSTTLEALVRFCQAVETLYTRDCLHRSTPRDLQRLLQKAEARGFSGMIGSIDCMHWQWKNCPTAWQGDYGNRKGQKSIILEAVAGFDTWVWHAFFGVAGSQNDLNELGQSPVFNDVLRGQGPNITYQVNNTVYQTGYYLADGIYPRWTTFVKSIPNPRSQKQNLFATYQEGYRKDDERCFGILQARWFIIRGSAVGLDSDMLIGGLRARHVATFRWSWRRADVSARWFNFFTVGACGKKNLNALADVSTRGLKLGLISPSGWPELVGPTSPPGLG
ncbi:hypothetical protein L3X38_012193 [Prunus dulcis]|uniref:Protein ALP1-like n=1 Tax=Prunus dulcis TaxID=3755 RepID=A0AAD4ZG52_PRUDU|nr:hypothetical protein L3X38_012193 [Prunus dulcis]